MQRKHLKHSSYQKITPRPYTNEYVPLVPYSMNTHYLTQLFISFVCVFVYLCMCVCYHSIRFIKYLRSYQPHEALEWFNETHGQIDCSLIRIPDPLFPHTLLSTAIYYWSRLPASLQVIDYRSSGHTSSDLLHLQHASLSLQNQDTKTPDVRDQLLACIQSSGGLTYKTTTYETILHEKMHLIKEEKTNGAIVEPTNDEPPFENDNPIDPTLASIHESTQDTNNIPACPSFEVISEPMPISPTAPKMPLKFTMPKNPSCRSSIFEALVIPNFDLSTLEMLIRAHPCIKSWSNLVEPMSSVDKEKDDRKNVIENEIPSNELFYDEPTLISPLLFIQLRWLGRKESYPLSEDDTFDNLCSKIAMQTSDESISIVIRKTSVLHQSASPLSVLHLALRLRMVQTFTVLILRFAQTGNIDLLYMVIREIYPKFIGVEGSNVSHGFIDFNGHSGDAKKTAITGGAKGVQDDQGLPGIQGIVGPTSITAAQGITRVQGITGAQGTPGMKGPQGIIGKDGFVLSAFPKIDWAGQLTCDIISQLSERDHTLHVFKDVRTLQQRESGPIPLRKDMSGHVIATSCRFFPNPNETNRYVCRMKFIDHGPFLQSSSFMNSQHLVDTSVYSSKGEQKHNALIPHGEYLQILETILYQGIDELKNYKTKIASYLTITLLIPDVIVSIIFHFLALYK